MYVLGKRINKANIIISINRKKLEKLNRFIEGWWLKTLNLSKPKWTRNHSKGKISKWYIWQLTIINKVLDLQHKYNSLS